MFGRKLLIVLGCLCLASCGPVYRDLDPAPIKSVSDKNVLPPDRAEVAFVMDTSGDQMSFNKWMVGLVVVAHYGNVYEHQTFANCDSPGMDGPYELPQDIFCDDRVFRLSVDGNAVRVEEVQDGKPIKLITRIDLPESVRSIEYNADLHMTFYYSRGSQELDITDIPPELQKFSEEVREQ